MLNYYLVMFNFQQFEDKTFVVFYYRNNGFQVIIYTEVSELEFHIVYNYNCETINIVTFI